MNDRLKFRVWDLDKKEYNQVGFLCSTMNENGIIEINCLKTNEGGYYYKNFVIEQSTGLKDKNGKLIFENDVVDIEYHGKSKVFWNGGWRVNGKMSVISFGKSNAKNCKIIGNIHQDSHLLGGK